MFSVVNDLEPYHAQNHVCVCLHVYAQATARCSEESLIFGKCLCNAMPSNITCFPVEATVKDYVFKISEVLLVMRNHHVSVGMATESILLLWL